MDSFESDHCPVCSKVVDVSTNIQISDEQREKYGDKWYSPGEDIKQIALTETEEQQRRELEELLRNGEIPRLTV